MRLPSLSADCARCTALCCVSLAFDRSHQFGLDKPAGVPCPHLTHADRCRIHTRRHERGFGGCVRYDCLGAGQRVSEVLPGSHWRQSAEAAQRVFEVFRQLRRVHEALELLMNAARLPLAPKQKAECSRIARLLTPEQPWTQQSLAELEDSPVFDALQDFLASLREHVERPRRRRRLPVL